MIVIEEDNQINSDYTIADLDDDDDAGIFSIAKDYTSEDDDILAEENIDRLAVHTRRTETNEGESAEEFLLAQEEVIRFVKDSILSVMDLQKRNADKHG